jgi:predicted histone-like DNA-binding protein
MTVKYNVVQRANPGDRANPGKFYPSIVSTGRLTLRDIAKLIADNSTLSSTDVMASIEAFLSTVPAQLAAGNIVELGDFGAFWLRNSGEGETNADDVTAKNVTNLLPRFTPGKEFKKVLRNVEFKKA